MRLAAVKVIVLCTEHNVQCVIVDVKGDTVTEDDTIDQSKCIFQAIRNNYNTINVTALERLPEKHYAH